MSVESYRTAQVVELPKDSTATILEIELIDDGSPVDLTGATLIKFNSKTFDDTQIDADLAGVLTNPGDPTDGKVDVTVSAAFIGTARDLLSDVRYTIGGLVTVSYPIIYRIFSGGKV